jgi:leucyl aminopeptidase (aminopeptidase T)
MKEVLMMKGAHKLVRMCARVREEEDVLIITDMVTFDCAKPLAKVAMQEGAREVTVFIMEPRKAAGTEPPKTVKAAMTSSDVIFIPTAASIAHTTATQEAREAGARVITMADFTGDMLISGAIEADFEEQAPVVEKIANMLTTAQTAELLTESGTHLTLNLKGRNGRALTGLATGKGGYSSPPNIEASIAPIENGTNGVIIVDGSIATIGLLHSPVKITFVNGKATDIEGGIEANKLRRLLSNADDPNVYFAAEFGLGLNPKAELKGSLLEDEAVFGSAHIALGSNADFGGKLRTPLHIDNIMINVTVKLDDTLIFDKGRLVI